jgi:hypothetical protein
MSIPFVMEPKLVPPVPFPKKAAPLQDGVKVELGVKVSAGVKVNVGPTGVLVGLFVAVFVGVLVGVTVELFVGVPVGELVGVFVAVFVRLLVGELVGVIVGEFVGVEVGVGFTMVMVLLLTGKVPFMLGGNPVVRPVADRSVEAATAKR